MDRYLILGAKGLVGQALMETLPNAIAWDRDELDVTNFTELQKRLDDQKGRIDAVINCVAYNDVDKAESNQDTAYLLNAELPKQLGLACKNLDIPLVHFSTGYVFDGEKERFMESDLPNPLSIYGQSKYKGELLVSESTGKHYIVRTNVVFGKPGISERAKRTFVQVVQELARKSNEISLVSDEVNSVTYAKDLASQVKLLLKNRLPFGIYHGINSGHCSWYEFGKEILKDKPEIIVKEIKGESLPRAAKRPQRVVLLNTKLPILRDWHVALEEFLKTNN